MSTSFDLREYHDRISQAMGGDRFRLRRKLQQLETAQRAGKFDDRQFARWRDELEKSVQRLAARRAGVPRVEYDAELPVVARRRNRGRHRRQPGVVVCGETGSASRRSFRRSAWKWDWASSG